MKEQNINAKQRTFLRRVRVDVVFYSIGILLLVVGTYMQTNAETLTLFFQNMVLSITDSTVENDAELAVKQYEVRWDNFETVLPPETDVTKIVLRFFVSALEQETIDVSDDIVVSKSSSTSEERTDVLEETTTTLTGTSTTEEISEDVVPDTNTVSIEQIPTIASDEVPFQGPTPVPEEEIEQDGGIVSDSFNSEALQTVEMSDIRVESFEDEAPLVDVYMSEALPLEVVVNETTATPTDPVYDSPGMYEVLYSLDGLQWQSVGEGDFRTSQDMTFDLSELSLGDIPSLEVVVVYTTDEGAHENILFSHMRLEIACALPEEVPLLMPITPVDLEPNFENSAIKADAQFENVRAVIIERGGMLEMWYGKIDSASKEVSWRQLASDGSLSATSPLAIREGIIFWLDKNQQTLFGFAIDTQSLFGDSLVSDNENMLRLQFTKRNSELSSVRYDSISNTFEFKNVD